MKTKLALIAAVAFVLASASALAQTKKFDCSPGYWKNHLEVWAGACGVLNCPLLIDMLHATGPANGQVKNLAADIINGWADENLETACEEES